MTLAEGTILANGRYRVEVPLGAGGMAAVYAVRHLQLNTRLALKVLTTQSADQRTRLLREGQAQAALRHPHVVSVLDVVEVDGQAALVMEYVDGPSLDQVLKRGRLTPAQADLVFRGILAGVAAAHDLGFVHRDLKPGNVLLASTRREVVARVADFGLVKQLGAERDATRTGAVMGTPAYMSPEQIRDSGKVDARSDVFALGAIAYELFSGRRAFEGEDAFDIFEAVIRGKRPALQEIAPDLDPRCVALIERALCTDPDERLASAVDFEARWLDLNPPRRANEVWRGSRWLRAAEADSSSPDPEVMATPETWDAGADVPVVGPTEPTLEATVESTEVPRTHSRRIWVALAALLLLPLAAVLWTRQPATTFFTVRDAPLVYEDAELQAQLERTWQLALEGNLDQAKIQIGPLLEEDVVPVDVLALAMTALGEHGGLTQFADLVGRVPDDQLAAPRGAAVCVRRYDDMLRSTARGVARPWSEELKQELLDWRVEHPEDLVTTLCAVGTGIALETVSWLDASDPSGNTPLVLGLVVERLLWHKRPAEAIERVRRARKHRDSASLMALEAAALAKDSTTADAGAKLFEQALEREPNRMDIRRKAAATAILRGDEAALQRHLPLLTAPEWPQAVREANAHALFRALWIKGRPTLALDILEPLDEPAGILQAPFVEREAIQSPGFLSAAHFSRVLAMFRKGTRAEYHPARAFFDASRVRLEVADLMYRGEERPAPDSRFDAFALGLLDAGDGNPQTLIEFEEGRHTYRGDADFEANRTCRMAQTRAAAKTLAGMPKEALDDYRVMAGDCGPQGFNGRAIAAAHLALDAFRRGQPEEAKAYVEIYHQRWPIAEDTLPVAVELAEFGVVTGPVREAWVAASE